MGNAMRYYEGHWFFNVSYLEWHYIAPGNYEEGVQHQAGDIAIRISEPVAQQLIRALDEGGHIKPRLDERLRAEDLKITHRLLDIIEKSQ